MADGQLPISAVPTSASVHDSQVAIPLMTLTSGRVTHLYELMDSAYDADSIHAHSRQLNHVPIIAPHPRRGTKKPSQMQKVLPDKPMPQLTWEQQERFKTRTMSERVNARLLSLPHGDVAACPPTARQAPFSRRPPSVRRRNIKTARQPGTLHTRTPLSRPFRLAGVHHENGLLQKPHRIRLVLRLRLP